MHRVKEFLELFKGQLTAGKTILIIFLALLGKLGVDQISDRLSANYVQSQAFKREQERLSEEWEREQAQRKFEQQLLFNRQSFIDSIIARENVANAAEALLSAAKAFNYLLELEKQVKYERAIVTFLYRDNSTIRTQIATIVLEKHAENVLPIIEDWQYVRIPAGLQAFLDRVKANHAENNSAVVVADLKEDEDLKLSDVQRYANRYGTQALICAYVGKNTKGSFFLTCSYYFNVPSEQELRNHTLNVERIARQIKRAFNLSDAA